VIHPYKENRLEREVLNFTACRHNDIAIHKCMAMSLITLCRKAFIPKLRGLEMIKI
jgi:hypothetical protein